MEQPIFFLF